MKIIIPTYRRDKQLTFSFFSKEAKDNTIFVVDQRDKDRLQIINRRPNEQFWVSPAKTIAEKRAWIIREAHSRGIQKICMFDDDLRFATRKSPDWSQTALEPAKPEQIDGALSWLSSILMEECPHAGFGPRQGNNNAKEEFACASKMMYALGYHVPTVMENAILGRMPFREDYDITLQLLRRGYNNIVCHRLVVDNVYNLPGGCRDERTVEASDAAAELLAALHPGLVKVVEKPYKGSVPRKEVIVSWKKALGAG